MIIFCFLNFVKFHENQKTFPFIIVYGVVGLRFKILIFIKDFRNEKITTNFTVFIPMCGAVCKCTV